MAVEGCTGWRYVVEEIEAAGFEAHVAEPADTQAARGRKQRAKTDRSDAPAVARVVAARRAAGVVDPADDRVGVARTGAAVQVAGRSALDVDAADPRRAVPARRRRARRRRSARPSTRGAAGKRRGDDDARRPGNGSRVGYSMIDATDVEAQPLKARPATLRACASRPVGRWSTASTGSAGCWRWRCGPSSATVDASPAPIRWCATAAWTSPSTPRIGDAPAGYLSRQGPPTLRWALFEAANNASHQRSPDHDYYTDGQGPSRRQAGRDLRRPPVRPALLPRAAQPRPRRRLRRRRLTPRRRRRLGTPTINITGLYRGQLPQPACPPASVLDGLRTLTRPRSHHGGHPITDCCRRRHTFVEHLGNAGRPHAAVNRPIASMHRPSGRSRSFVLASLRALHLDQRLRPGALRTKRALTTRAHTGNDVSAIDHPPVVSGSRPSKASRGVVDRRCQALIDS